MSVGQKPAVEQWGMDILTFDEVVSTNEIARQMAKEGAPCGTVVSAKTQSASYGRHGRQWFSPSGGLWFSIILRSETMLDGLSLLFALWTTQFIESHVGIDTEIYWPNDIYAQGRKLGGILLEGVSGENGFTVAGIGLNINNSSENLDASCNAVSLREITGSYENLDYFLEDLLMHLQFNYESSLSFGFPAFLDDIRDKCPFIGKKVKIALDNGEFDALAEDIGKSGQLVVKKNDGIIEEIWSCNKIRLV